jgi:hypothetical protein
LLALACAAFLPAVARRNPLPYRAVVEVTAAPKVREATWRGELAAVITDRLRLKGCLAALEDPGGTDADLRVHVHVEDLRKELVYGTSLAQSVSPDAVPEVRDNKTAQLRATLRVELIRIASGEKIEEKRLTVDVRREPRTLGEDVEDAARQEAMEQAGDRVAQVVCKAKAPAR